VSNAPLTVSEMSHPITKAFLWLKRHPNPNIRISFGILFIIGGILGPFLPILGVWMIPLGLILLFAKSPYYWRLRRRYVVWRRNKRARKKQSTS